MRSVREVLVICNKVIIHLYLSLLNSNFVCVDVSGIEFYSSMDMEVEDMDLS